MNLETARQTEAQLNELVEERSRIYTYLEESNNVSVATTASEMKAAGASDEAVKAYQSDEIGQAYFDFLEALAERQVQIRQEIKALPRIPMALFLEMKKTA